MAATTRNDVSSTGILQEWLNRDFIPNLDAQLQFLQLAERPDMPDGYNTLRWATFTNFNESDVTTGTTSTDGVTPADTAFTITSVTTTPTQYRIVASLSDMLLEGNPMPLLEKVRDRIAYIMAKVMDTVIQTSVMAGTYAIYGGTQTTRAGLGAGDVITVQNLNRAAAELLARDVPTFDGNSYVAVLHPYQVYDLRTSTATGSWLDIAKYAMPDKIYSGEIGTLFNIRVLMSSHVQPFTSTVQVYPALVVGRGAFGVGFRQQPQILITPGGSIDSDPAAQRRKVAGKMAFGTVILNNAAMVRVETAATVA